MQLDQTHVAIRARTMTEIADLAMVMIRSYPYAAIFGFALGALPWAIANAALLGWIPWQEYSVLSFDEEMASSLVRYQVLMTLLVFLQAPAAGVFTTLYIGQAVFESQPTWLTVFNEAKSSFWRWFWVLGVLRGAIPLMLLIALGWSGGAIEDLSYVWPVILVGAMFFLRANRPFMPEILLLERCPLRAKMVNKIPTAITAKQRSSALHSPIGTELFGRFTMMSVLLPILAWLGFYGLIWMRGILFGVWEWDLFVYLVLFPIALWATASLSVLVRFLSYLDTRIRLEGWEVQLAVRAEALRQFGEADIASLAKGTGS